MVRLIKLAVTTPMFLFFFLVQTLASDLSAVRSSLAALRADILSGMVMDVHIYFMSYSTRTSIRVTPQRLERYADRKDKFVISSQLRDTLVAAIDGAKLYETKYRPDLRWGAIFVDKAERQVHSLYLNSRYFTGTGRIGIIDGANVGLNGALITWFESNFIHD